MANSTSNIVSYFRSFFIPNKPTNGYVNGPQTKLFPFSIGSLLNIFPSINTQKALDEGFSGNATVYSIVRDSGNKFGSIPRFICQDTLTSTQKSKYLRYKANAPYADEANMNDPRVRALGALINRPNPGQGQDVFLATLFSSYLVTGEAFVWLNRGFQVNGAFQYVNADGTVATDDELDKMPVLQMYWLPSNFMTLLPDPNDPWDINGWVLIYQGYEVYLRKQDVIQWKTPSLSFDVVTRTHLRGVSPLKAGGGILQENTAAVLSAVRTFQNDGARGLLFADYDSAESIAPGSMDQARQVIDKKINSNNNSNSVATLLGKWDYLDLSKPETMPLMDGQRYSDQQLCMLFGMPYELIQPGTTFANKQMALKNWINNTIIPACKQLDDELNRQLLKAFDLVGKVCICADFKSLTELQDDMQSQVTSLSMAPWLTYNEKRIAMGYDPLPDPSLDSILVPTGVIPISSMQDELDQINQPLTGDYDPNAKQ